MNILRARAVLVVEDDNVAARVAWAVVESRGLRFFRAGSIRAARLIFRPREFALAVVDLGLPEDDRENSPGGDGLELIRSFRELDPSLPVLAWSADASPARAARTAALGCRLVDKGNGIEELRRACRLASLSAAP